MKASYFFCIQTGSNTTDANHCKILILIIKIKEITIFARKKCLRSENVQRSVNKKKLSRMFEAKLFLKSAGIRFKDSIHFPLVPQGITWKKFTGLKSLESRVNVLRKRQVIHCFTSPPQKFQQKTSMQLLLYIVKQGLALTFAQRHASWKISPIGGISRV